MEIGRLPSDDNEARTVLSSVLDSGEALYWAGRPRQGIFLRKGDILLIPFSLMWGGFAIFWEVAALRTNKAQWFAALWGVPFVAVGVYMIIGRFFLDAWIRSRTYYGVTDRRVIIQRRGFGVKTTSYDKSNLPPLSLEESSNGFATIRLGDMPQRSESSIEGTPWPGTRTTPCFEQIADGKAVYDLIRRKP